VRSPLEILGGRFEHALLTTYSFNLRFFEEWVLRALWASEVRNVVVFVDRHELGHALNDRAPSAAGRAYHVVAAAASKAAFHPKLVLVTGSNGARLCVSSANLTPDGQLRNAESAIAFDSSLSGHRRPIHDAGDVFRRLAANAPAHTAAAIQAALAALPDNDNDNDNSPYRLVHNLDRPLIDNFPATGATRAIAPYVDADGAAASALHQRGELTVIVDGSNVAASAGFFAGPWTIEPRTFDARLHGKGYEIRTDEGRWAMVGSPNLSAPALLQPASSGNLEIAVAVTIEQPLALPESTPFENADRLPELAAARLHATHEHVQARQATGRAFDAWEEERRIVVSGIPDGARLQRWKDERWHLLGTVADGAVFVADPDLRPTRIRAVLTDGRIAYAVVALPARLRARMKAPTSGRQTHAAERLPLDVETVRVLEDALSQLYALQELAGEAPKINRAPTPAPRPGTDQTEGLHTWMPRSAEEEPRVPPLYTKNWKGEPDALLALISRVLRIDRDDEGAGEDEVGREHVDLEDLENITSSAQVEVKPTADENAPRPAVDPKELNRYRQAFQRLFFRGQQFVAQARDPTLAGWAFTYLLRLVEDLGSHFVEMQGMKEPLMQRDPLLTTSLDLLETYLNRGERDLLCLATARVHLAAAVRQRARFTPRDRERLDRLCFTWASDLVAVPGDLPAPAPDALNLDVASAIAWLEDYAERSSWNAIEDEAEARLDPGWLERHPWPVIIGRTSFSDRVHSPAWALLAFAAPAGFEAKTPFGVVLHNGAPDSRVSTHAVVCDPHGQLIVEAWERAGDGLWHERRYGPVSRRTVERVSNPSTLPAHKVIPRPDFERVEEPLRSLAPLLLAAAAGLD
jgi:hypothetical protein